MAQNDVFYRRATSGYGEIANLDIIPTKRMKKVVNYTIPGGTNPESLREPAIWIPSLPSNDSPVLDVTSGNAGLQYFHAQGGGRGVYNHTHTLGCTYLHFKTERLTD